VILICTPFTGQTSSSKTCSSFTKISSCSTQSSPNKKSTSKC